MINPLTDIFSFLDMGGEVLIVLMVSSIIFWTVLIEKFMYFKFIYRPKSKEVRRFWKDKEGSMLWANMQIKQAQVSRFNVALKTNIPVLKALIALFPLMGLLGTVTGMISVFDSMGAFGTNAKAMAGGISMATIPTMAGMLLAVLGIFAYSRLDYIIKREIRKLKDKILKDSDA
ncbi:MotA/TolQ/ExbB proton channel family protein [Sulfurimonas sp. MAG313]|nr:MotA/TolQ/ExbB proton channel family protein [Sulfurimonas sp. MAG313]MDF1880023.1 MotA/TolQ/ExbB proton channel family protein [Sulfurimonas sp. MAG313]